MGKGGTRFVGDAIGARETRVTGGSSKDRRRAMEAFLDTGVHPEVRRMREAEALGRPLPPLPPPLRSRPHVYLQFSINRKDAGKVVIELFDDILPAPARHFQARCTTTARDTFSGTRVHKILSGATLFGGISQRYEESVTMKREASLRHVAPGAVSISIDGSEFEISLAKALQLDDTHQVVGQVVKGLEVAEKIAELATRADDVPCQAVVVERCGLTDYEGVVDVEATGPGGDGVGGEEALARDEDETRNVVQQALEAGKKRKEGAAGVGPVGRPAKRKSAMDAVLLGGSSGSDSSSCSDSES